MTAWVFRIFEVFRFIQRYRDRQLAREETARQERREEREHQRLMLEAIFNKVVENSKQQSDAIIQLAKAQQSSADVLTTWLKGFQITNPNPEPPQTVRPEDEWAREQVRLREMGVPVDDPEFMENLDLPPEFRIAYELQRAEADAGARLSNLNQAQLEKEGFDREV